MTFADRRASLIVFYREWQDTDWRTNRMGPQLLSEARLGAWGGGFLLLARKASACDGWGYNQENG